MENCLIQGTVILSAYRISAFNSLFQILNCIRSAAPELSTIRFSEIIKLSSEQQERIFSEISSIAGSGCLSPLTVIIDESESPVLHQYFRVPKDERQLMIDKVVEVLKVSFDQHSNEATDIRYFVLCYMISIGKLVITQQDQMETIINYPQYYHDEEIMRLMRPSVRAAEMMVLVNTEADEEYLNSFWLRIGEITDCDLSAIMFNEENTKAYRYVELLYAIMQFLVEKYKNEIPNNEKMNVLLGLLTYSFKRFNELIDHNLCNTIAGRSCIRGMLETYIMIRYLIINESQHENIWKDFKLYGLGKYKLILKKRQEEVNSRDYHFDDELLNLIVNEFYEEEYLNMDTRYFDGSNVREKFDLTGEKELYTVYDYDTSFEHGFWGAIRESSMFKCSNPAHQYHCVPDYDCIITLKSALKDAVQIMNKSIRTIGNIYEIPEDLMVELSNFESDLMTTTSDG